MMIMMRSNKNTIQHLVVVVMAATALLAVRAAAASSPAKVSSVNDLEFDENHKLKSHTLVYSGAACDSAAGLDGTTFTSDRFELYKLTPNSPIQSQIFPGFNPVSTRCRAACIERGADRTVANAIMPHKQYDSVKMDFEKWFENECRSVEVCVMNYLETSKTKPLKLYWIRPSTNEPKFHLSIEYGEPKTKCFNSFLGHKFEAYQLVGDDEKEELVGKLTIEFITVMAFGELKSSGTLSTSRLDKFNNQISGTLKHEWDRHNMVKRTFSPLGFKKGKLPRDVFSSMGAFYYNNRNYKVLEEWGNRGLFVNWWEADVYVIPLPWGLRDLWQVRLRDMVSAWAGIPVEQTVMYGLREYTDGARLLTHVDRRLTHAVSLIVNVAQGNLTEPWPVEVQDHVDRMHEVIMEPGDVVYYESAKCLHGRNRPLPGGYYANLFTHYRPIGEGDKWYEKPNHDGTPPPVLEDDIVGTCQLKPMGTTAMGTGQLGVVDGVQCDDPRLGPNISPTLFQAKNADDLVKWWRMTDPTNEDVTIIHGSNSESYKAKKEKIHLTSSSSTSRSDEL